MSDERRNDDYQTGSDQTGTDEYGTGTDFGTTGTGTTGTGTTGTGTTGTSGQPGATGGSRHGRTVTEEFRVSGEAVVSKVKELVREGNVRRITIKNDEGKVLIEIPLTIGVIGTVLLPVWAAIGAIAALVANLTISVEKTVDSEQAAKGPGQPGDITRS